MKFWMVFFLISLVRLNTPLAYEFHCSWVISGWDSDYCPVGYYRDDTTCGCDVDAAPTWYGGQLTMKVEAEGGNGITAAEFLLAGQEAATAWTNISQSDFVVDASQSLPANSDARWGEHNNDQNEHGIFYVTTQEEWIEVTGAGIGGALGVAVSPYYDLGCNTREYFDSDILINGFLDDGWTYPRLMHTVLHEMGHSAGLGHPCMLGYLSSICDNDCVAVMGASGGDYTTPRQDDFDGLSALYPGTPGGLGSACTFDDECDIATPVCASYDGFSYCSHNCGTCEEGYQCVSIDNQDLCVRQGGPSVGETCYSVCETDALCVFVAETHGVCFWQCDPAQPNCDTDHKCIELASNVGVCFPPGTQQVGDECGSWEIGYCAPELVCLLDIPNVDDFGHCYQSCDGLDPSSCGMSSLCINLGNEGYCVDAAGPGENCEVTDYYCIDQYTCAPESSRAGYTCLESCDWNQINTCADDEECIVVANDGHGNPSAAACYPKEVPNPDKEYMEACSFNEECISLKCRLVSSYGTICVIDCDPSYGHRDCPILSDSGCKPNDVEDLSSGGYCVPGLASEGELELGEPCNITTGFIECKSGLCVEDFCSAVCNNGSCPPGFYCEEREGVEVCLPDETTNNQNTNSNQSTPDNDNNSDYQNVNENKIDDNEKDDDDKKSSKTIFSCHMQSTNRYLLGWLMLFGMSLFIRFRRR